MHPRGMDLGGVNKNPVSRSCQETSLGTIQFGNLRSKQLKLNGLFRRITGFFPLFLCQIEDFFAQFRCGILLIFQLQITQLQDTC